MLRRLLVGFAFLVVLLPMAGAQNQYAGGPNRWDLYGPAYWGNLTWNGGQGGIAWTPDPPSDDNVPPDPNNANTYTLDNAIWWYTEARVTPPRTFTFTSAPLPVPLYLNVSRNVQLELVLTDPENKDQCGTEWYYSGNDPISEVRLLWQDRVIGGHLATDYVNNWIDWWWHDPASSEAPPPPEGYTVCRYAFGLETDHLPAGAVVKLEVTFYQQDRPYSFGLKDDHRSNIRFPLYPPDEVVFRYPELQVEEEEETQVDAASNARSAAALGLVSLFAVAAARRRTVLGVAVVVLLLLAGCAGPKAGPGAGGTEELRGRADITQIRQGGAQGAIIGVVHDDLHIPLGGVHVSLLGSANFTDTDARGRFKFETLSPGEYRLRFDKKDFQGFETDVTVKAGFTARPIVTLYPVGYKGRDFRPHDHDYWPPGASAKELMNRPLGVVCDGLGSTSCSMPEWFAIPPTSPDFATVIPGTRTLRIVLDWNPAQTGFDRLGLNVVHNGDFPPYFDGYWFFANQTVYAPRGPGVPFLISTNWEMADPGHQKLSSWRFYPYVGDVTFKGGYVQGQARPYDPTYSPQVTVKMTATKGALPLEAPHPEHWKDSSEFSVLKSAKPDPYGYGYWETCLMPQAANDATGDCERGFMSYWMPTKVVPYGTTEVEVKVSFNRAPNFPVKLLYKPANVPFPDYYSTNGFKDAGVGEGSGSSFSWKVKILPEESDPEYAKRSMWEFRVMAADHDAAWLDYANSVATLGQVQKYLEPTLTVTARKTG